MQLFIAIKIEHFSTLEEDHKKWKEINGSHRVSFGPHRKLCLFYYNNLAIKYFIRINGTIIGVLVVTL